MTDEFPPDDQIPPAVRGAVETNIDGIVEDIDPFAELLVESDVLVDEDALVSFVLGFVLANAQVAFHAIGTDYEMSPEILVEITDIVSRRKREIVSAYREEYDEF